MWGRRVAEDRAGQLLELEFPGSTCSAGLSQQGRFSLEKYNFIFLSVYIYIFLFLSPFFHSPSPRELEYFDIFLSLALTFSFIFISCSNVSLFFFSSLYLFLSPYKIGRGHTYNTKIILKHSLSLKNKCYLQKDIIQPQTNNCCTKVRIDVCSSPKKFVI